MNIIHLLCYVASVRTADFVTAYAQISCLGSFMFSFCVVPKDVLKTASVDKKVERLHARAVFVSRVYRTPQGVPEFSRGVTPRWGVQGLPDMWP